VFARVICVAFAFVRARVAHRGARGWSIARPVAPVPLVSGPAAARVVARVSSVAVTQAACSWATWSGEAEGSIAPVEDPAPLMVDLASFRAVSEPIQRQW
jgi:hypothetical protein